MLARALDEILGTHSAGGGIPCHIQPRSVIIQLRNHDFGYPLAGDTLTDLRRRSRRSPQPGPGTARGGTTGGALIADDDPARHLCGRDDAGEQRAWPGAAAARLSPVTASPGQEQHRRCSWPGDPGVS